MARLTLPKPLPLEFYERETKVVARELLGKVLFHDRDGELTSGMIIETEAYLGVRDSAAHTDRDLCSGPGKLCRAMAIDRNSDGLSLVGSELWIGKNPSGEIKTRGRIKIGPRVGVDYATAPPHRPARDWPLRFRLEGF